MAVHGLVCCDVPDGHPRGLVRGGVSLRPPRGGPSVTFPQLCGYAGQDYAPPVLPAALRLRGSRARAGPRVPRPPRLVRCGCPRRGVRRSRQRSPGVAPHDARFGVGAGFPGAQAALFCLGDVPTPCRAPGVRLGLLGVGVGGAAFGARGDIRPPSRRACPSVTGLHRPGDASMITLTNIVGRGRIPPVEGEGCTVARRGSHRFCI